MLCNRAARPRVVGRALRNASQSVTARMPSRTVACASTHVTIPPPEHPNYSIEEVIKAALIEDAGDMGDVTTLSTVPAGTQATATFKAKAVGTVAGVAVADMVFAAVDPSLKPEWTKMDGDTVEFGEIFGTVTGDAASLLVAERVALNFMQRMSGIATATAEMVTAVEGTGCTILETRKTVPGLRLLDKWAVLIGGGMNHRMGLFDMVMIKDNHIASAGGITPAVQRCQTWLREKGQKLPIEVETRTFEEVEEVMQLITSDPDTMVTRVMLDNMTKLDASAPDGIDVSMLAEAVKMVDGRVETEASGNVTQATVRAIAATGATYVSVGALTHSVMALDISMNIEM